MSPEVILDRYLRSYDPPLEVRQCYPTKQDLDRLEPPELGWILGMVQAAINERYASFSTLTKTPLGPLAIHLDFTETPREQKHVAENAVSFVREGYAFLILSIPIVRRVFSICEEVGLTPAICELLQIESATQKDRANLIAMLAVIQLQFIGIHELGHHIHGHCYNEDLVSMPVQEFDDESTQDTNDRLHQQAMEVEADCHAARVQVEEILTPRMGDGIFKVLNPHGIDRDVFLLNFLFVAIASYMFLKLQSAVDHTTVRMRKHPPALVRMNVVMRDLRTWFSTDRSDLMSWTSEAHFQRMMRAIETCYGESDSPRFWREQGQFLKATDGEQYMEALDAEREQLWEEMKPCRWETFAAGQNKK